MKETKISQQVPTIYFEDAQSNGRDNDLIIIRVGGSRGIIVLYDELLMIVDLMYKPGWRFPMYFEGWAEQMVEALLIRAELIGENFYDFKNVLAEQKEKLELASHEEQQSDNKISPSAAMKALELLFWMEKECKRLSA